MDINDLKVINEIYIKLLKKGLNMSDLTNTIKNAEKLEEYSIFLSDVCDKINSLMDLSEKYAKRCLDKATEIREIVHINPKPNENTFLYAYKNGKKLTWGELSDREDDDKKLTAEIKKATKKLKIDTKTQYKKMSKIYDVNLSHQYMFPNIPRLENIPPAIYWFNGNNSHPKGLYMNINGNLIIKIPLPNVIDSTKEQNREKTIRCRYNTTQECYNYRKETAKKYKSHIRKCFYTHKGEQFAKIGANFRCPNLPRFGNHENLNNDITKIRISDIRCMLLYASSDILLSSLWYQRNNQRHIMSDIEICQ